MKAEVQKEFDILAHQMDLRHDFLSKLYKEYPNYEDCPDKWKPDWLVFKKDGFRNWRHMPKVLKKVKRSAKIAAKNKKQ